MSDWELISYPSTEELNCEVSDCTNNAYITFLPGGWKGDKGEHNKADFICQEHQPERFQKETRWYPFCELPKDHSFYCTNIYQRLTNPNEWTKKYMKEIE